MASDFQLNTQATEQILASVDISAKEFSTIAQIVYQVSGIKLTAGKEGLVKTRLSKRLRVLSLPNFQEYIRHIENDPKGAEKRLMIDLLTTNKTDFFREMPHFDFLKKTAIPYWKSNQKKIRIWSAGCSSGEEPFSYGMWFWEEFGELASWDLKILATDLSVRVLTKARQSLYEWEQVADVPAPIINKYFLKNTSTTPPLYQVHDKVRNLVSFAQLNLMETWPMKGPFDLISCRNVMIYFDKPTQERLIQRYSGLLVPGGFLFVGHSESLSSIHHDLDYMQPATFRKPQAR